MPIKKYKPTSPSTSSNVGLDIRRDHDKYSRRNRFLRRFSKKLVATTKVKLRFAIMAADINVNTGLSTSNAIKMAFPASVATIEYDPNRTSNIALIHYVDGEKAYIIAPKGLKVGDEIVSGPDADIKMGNALPLENIPVGTVIHNIELKPGKGGQLVRAAGTRSAIAR